MNLHPILSLIGRLEAPKGYNQVYGGSVIWPEKPITTMTLREVRDWQERSVRAGSASSAVGRYQILRKTLDGLVAEGAAKWTDKFTPKLQDHLAIHLMKGAGLTLYQSGGITTAMFANRLARVWASLPVTTGPNKGRSHYAGDGLNKALVDVETVLDAVRAITTPTPFGGFWAALWARVVRLFNLLTKGN